MAEFLKSVIAVIGIPLADMSMGRDRLIAAPSFFGKDAH